MLDNNFQRGVLAVFGSVLVDISVGEINLLGFLYPYFISYFRLYNPGLKIEDMRAIPTYWLLAQIYSCPLGIYMYTKIGFRYTYLIFVTSFCLVQWLSSYITNFSLFAFIYGMSGGTSQGALLILPIYCCWRYFDKIHKPKVSGAVLSAYALSPLFTSYLALYAVNPHNESQTLLGDDGKHYFTEEVAMRVPGFLRMFGVVCAIIGYLGTFMVLEPIVEKKGGNEYEMALLSSTLPKDSDISVVKRKIEEEKKRSLDDRVDNITHVSISEALSLFKLEDFRSMYVIMIISFMFPHIMNFTFKSIGLAHLKNDAYVTFVGSLGAAINALSRLFVGLAYQKYGYRKLGLAIFCTEIATAVLYIPFASNGATYLLATAAFEITYGGQLGMYPLVSDQLFKKKGAMYYAYLYSSFTFSLIIGLNGYSFITNHFGQYTAFLVVAAITLIALPFILRIAHLEAGSRSVIDSSNYASA